MAVTTSVQDSPGLATRQQERRTDTNRVTGKQTREQGTGKASFIMVDGFALDSVNYRPTVKYEALCAGAPC